MTAHHHAKQMHEQPKNANQQLEETFTRLERMALTVTKRVGTFGFFLAILAWSALWLSWNTLGPSSARFDPAPAFVLWLIVSNLIQILLMPLLLVGQNLQGRHSEIRAENDFAVNKRAEREIASIIEQLASQRAMLAELTSLIKTGSTTSDGLSSTPERDAPSQQ